MRAGIGVCLSEIKRTGLCEVVSAVRSPTPKTLGPTFSDFPREEAREGYAPTMPKSLPLPGPAAWISAVVLLVFSSFVFAGVAIVLPGFLEWAKDWPRLGALAGLALVLSPGLGLVVAHHAAKGVLDRAEKRPDPRGILPSVESVWAGLFGWCVVVFAFCVSTFVTLALFPPKEPDALLALLRAQADPRLLFSIRSIVWLVAAAFAYEAEGRTRVGR